MNISTRHLFLYLLFIGIFAMTLRPIADPDFWWHLQTGHLIAETHTIPTVDPYSHTLPERPWIAHEWLSELLMYYLYAWGGIFLLVITFSLIITTSYILCYSLSTGKPYAAGFVVLLAALASAPTWGVRPQMISLLFTSITFFLLEKFRTSGEMKSLYPLPILTIIWVNFHAGYFLGFVIIALYISGGVIEKFIGTRSMKIQGYLSEGKLAATLLLCVLTSLVNPNTYHILTYPFETLTSGSMMAFIQEWFSPNFHDIEWLPLAFLFIALISFPLLFKRSVPITHVMLVGIFGLAALRSMRHVPLFAMMSVPILSEQLNAVVRLKGPVGKPPRFSRWLNPALVILVLLVVGIYLSSIIHDQEAAESKAFPVNAVAWIQENHPDGMLYNTYSWGGYLIWELFPQYQVFIDGRADVYGDAFIVEFRQIYTGQEGWESSLDRYGVRLVLVEPGSGLAVALKTSADWDVVFADDLSILFYRR